MLKEKIHGFQIIRTAYKYVQHYSGIILVLCNYNIVHVSMGEAV